MINTAVFDLDGTLVDTAPDLAGSLNHCLIADGLEPLPLATVRPHAGHGAKAMLALAYRLAGRDLYPDLLETQTARFLDHYRQHLADHSRPFPGALDAMDRLTDDGWRLAICTNKFEALARDLLDRLDLSKRFAAICGADTFSRRKPDPVHLSGTIERAGGMLPHAVMIGDTDTDMAVAAAAGVASILVDFGYGPDEAVRGLATRVVGTYEELDAALCRALIQPVGTE